MSHRLVIRAEAETDITDAAIWYQNQRRGLGEEFIAEVDAALKNAVANPRQHPRLRRKPDVRRILTRRFPIASSSCSGRICHCRVSHASRGQT
jgi:hypothetical protein